MAAYAHPREEHLIPLMVAAGAGGDDAAAHIFRDHVLGWTVSAFRFG
jgi:aromatic ring-opening dioxygenase catalytic subunit (LigB family)